MNLLRIIISFLGFLFHLQAASATPITPPLPIDQPYSEPSSPHSATHPSLLPYTSVYSGPALNWTALTDPALLDYTALMLVSAPIIKAVESSSRNSTTPNVVPSETQTQPQSQPQPQPSAADKSKAIQETQNFALLGSTLGATLRAGLVNAMDGKTKALCKALAAGAGSALGAKIGQLGNSIFQEPQSKPSVTSIVLTVNGMTTTTISTIRPSGTSKPKYSNFEHGFVGAMAGTFVGGSSSWVLEQAFCSHFADKIADSLSKTLLDVDRAYARSFPRVLLQTLKENGVTDAQALQFTSRVEALINDIAKRGTVDAVQPLQRALVAGASQIADRLAAGQTAELTAPLAAISQLGAALGVAPAPAGLAAAGVAMTNPFASFQSITNQISQLNNIASSLPGTASGVTAQLQPIIHNLHQSASAAANDVQQTVDLAGKGAKLSADVFKLGSNALKGVGTAAFNALKLIPNHDKSHTHEQTKHVTVTHTVTQVKTLVHTVESTRFVDKAHDVYKTNLVKVTDADHQKAGHDSTHWITRTETEHFKVTETAHKIETEKVKVTETVYKTKTKTKKEKVKETEFVTRTKETTHTVQATHMAEPQIIQEPHYDNSLSRFSRQDGSVKAVCRMDADQHLDCYGADEDAIKYKGVSNKKFVKCIRKGSAHCFDKHASTDDLLVFLDQKFRLRGVVCASVEHRGKVQCWGTPNRSTIKYKKMNPVELARCQADARACPELKGNR